jgi:hypothetical protein
MMSMRFKRRTLAVQLAGVLAALACVPAPAATTVADVAARLA